MEQHKMTFLDHLNELRTRLLWSLLAVAVFFVPAYAFSSHVFEFLMQPIINSLPEGSSMIYTRPAEGFMTYLKVSFFAAVVCAVPFILYQGWKFIAPALYKHEKQILIPFIVFGTLFFGLGASFCYYVASPKAFHFLLNEYSSEYVKAFPSIQESLSFFMALIVGFGFVFEFPLVIFILARMGVVNSKWLREKRKFAILISAVVAAVLTPTTDALSMMFMFVPIIIFYEIGIVVAWLFGKKKEVVKFDDGSVDEDGGTNKDDESGPVS